jgi:hypothetical protein
MLDGLNQPQSDATQPDLAASQNSTFSGGTAASGSTITDEGGKQISPGLENGSFDYYGVTTQSVSNKNDFSIISPNCAHFWITNLVVLIDVFGFCSA